VRGGEQTGEETGHQLGVLAQRPGGFRAYRRVGQKGQRHPAVLAGVLVEREHRGDDGPQQPPRIRILAEPPDHLGEPGLVAVPHHADGERHHLVPGPEVVLHHPGRHARLGRDVAQADRFQAAVRGDPHQGVRDQRAPGLVVDLLGHGADDFTVRPGRA
jgi:hypothetical protein